METLPHFSPTLSILCRSWKRTIHNHSFQYTYRDQVIKETLIQDSSDEVDVCLLILYNYLTIEKYREMLLVRFLALRNMETNTSYVTEAYWAVQKSRQAVVQEFIRDIEVNLEDGPLSALHQGYTGLKIRCYIGGNDPDNVAGDFSLTHEHRVEIQDYIRVIKGESDDYNDGACSLAAHMGENIIDIHLA